MSEVKIAAFLQRHSPSVCKFNVEGRELLPGRAVEYADADVAAPSPLAARLFKIEGILLVRISKNLVTVTRKQPDDWAPAAKAIGTAIAEVLAGTKAPVPSDAGQEILSDDALAEKVKEVLDTEVAEAVASHGGTVALAEVKDGDVYLKMGGACQGCASSTATLKQGVERTLRGRVPDIGEIHDVTDHESGANPYYK